MSRAIVHEEVYEEYIAMLKEKCNQIKIGDPLEDDTRMGALISEQHLQSVDNFVKDTVAAGATLLYGGERMTEGTCKNGPFYKPTLLGDVRPDMNVWKCEVFGPVLSVIRYRELDEAIRLANDTVFGLGANIFTENLKKAYWIAQKLNAGSVWVNLPNGMNMACPFGGNKNSGMLKSSL